uniref:Reverse transcriptase domain-containing protein n=1 Tax=Trichobilharzia regenti TaxID=157069 RepID=A0AA85KI49_TRIRE|nr:unnamed protein product [Trichobilharzia regenti]
MQALVDTGSSESYISSSVVRKYNWKVHKSRNRITMASTNLTSHTEGHCFLSICYKNHTYDLFKFSILHNLCADVLLGHDFLKLHKHIEIPFGGSRPPFSLCGLPCVRVDLPTLFENLSKDCKPIAIKSRRYSCEDESFISTEVNRLLQEGVIEPSNSPWRAQVLVTSNERHKKRMVVDYSQTINRFTFLDAYPLPRIDEMIEKIAQYDIFSTLDLKNAYHQIALKNEDKPYTAFEACGKLYQFCRIPFGVTNGVACFQRIIDELISKEQLTSTFAYIDNVTTCGKTREEHDKNLNKFMVAARNYGITLNDSKSVISSRSIQLLGYEVSKGLLNQIPIG